MRTLEIPEAEFYAYSQWTRYRRGYKSNWAFVIHKINYGRWVGRHLKNVEPQEPSQEYLDWLDEYQQNYNK